MVSDAASFVSSSNPSEIPGEFLFELEDPGKFSFQKQKENSEDKITCLSSQS